MEFDVCICEPIYSLDGGFRDFLNIAYYIFDFIQLVGTGQRVLSNT